MPSVDYELVTPNADPGSLAPISRTYRAQPKSFFLSRMISTLLAGGNALYKMGRGSLPHKFLDAMAVEMSLTDREWEASVGRAERQSAYVANGITPRNTTFSTGVGVLTRRTPAPTVEVIAAGTLLSSSDGRTGVTIASVTFNVGNTQKTVNIRSEIPGPGGDFAAGEVNQILSQGAPYNFINTTPVTGGREAETAGELFARLQDFVELRASSRPAALEARARNVVAALLAGGTVSARDVVMIQPALIPQLNYQSGLHYLVVESGGGIAANELVTATQAVVQPFASGGTNMVTISSASFAITPTITYTYDSTTPGLSLSDIQALITDLFIRRFQNARIEDGRGRGELDMLGLDTYLLSAHPSLLTLSVANVPGTVQPPVGAVAVAGTIIYVPIGV